MSWDTIRAEEYCESVRDGTHDTPKPVSNGYKLVTGKHIQNGQIDPTDAYFISENDYRKINERSKVEKWDVLMSMIGNGLGRSAVVIKKPDYAIKNIALFKVGDEKKAKWLHYYLSSPQGQGFIYNSLQGSGQPFISLSFIRDFPIPTPPLPYLNKAVSILEIYDDLIENNQKQIKLLEEAAQRLYKEWFVDLHFPGWEETKIVDGVPEGWEKKTIFDMSSVLRRGISPKYNDKGKYTVINQKCIRQTIMDIKESRQQEKEYPADMNLKDSDIVICSTGSGTLGRVGQVFGDYPDTTFDSHVTLVRAKKPDHSQFLFLTLKYLQPLLMTLGQGSTNQLELPKRVIESYEIICPTEKLIIDFESAILPIHNKITSLVSIIKNATEARDRLLPKLMSGEVEV